MERLTRNVYAQTGFRFAGCNTGFVVTTEGVVMIDTPMMPVNAIKWRDELAEYGTVRYLINTEPHLDHTAGNSFFGGTGIAHEGTREATLNASVEQFRKTVEEVSPESLPLLEGFEFRPASVTFSQRLTFRLGAHTFHLIHMPGHSPSQVAVFVPEERVVFTSDNITGRMPFMHQALPYEWLESLKQLQELVEELEADILVPGHGDVCDRSYIPKMSVMVQGSIDVVKEAIKKGLTVEEAMDRLTMPGKENIPPDDVHLPYFQRLGIARLYEMLKK